MTTLLIIIYITFISLGLPDAVLGSSWPKMHLDLQASIPAAGAVAMIISGGTIISSLYSYKLIHKFGTARLTVISVLMTAIALLGISFTPNYLVLCLLAIPLGLGAGAVDSALNNFVALHYHAKHMNWLHCFWGIGATAGPMLMALFLAEQNGWRAGYLLIGIIQIALVICLFITLPLWKRADQEEEIEEKKEPTKLTTLIKIRGAKSALIGFFCYTSIEMTAGLWGSSYLVIHKGISANTAALWVSFFYIGITFGRFLSGFMTVKFNNVNIIRIGQALIILGALFMIMPFSNTTQVIGLVILGLGCAPIYPSMLHETPNRFGKRISQGIMGIQMAIAYVGSTFMPPIIGYVSNKISFGVFPFILLIIGLFMILSTESINRLLAKRKLVS